MRQRPAPFGGRLGPSRVLQVQGLQVKRKQSKIAPSQVNEGVAVSVSSDSWKWDVWWLTCSTEKFYLFVLPIRAPAARWHRLTTHAGPPAARSMPAERAERKRLDRVPGVAARRRWGVLQRGPGVAARRRWRAASRAGWERSERRATRIFGEPSRVDGISFTGPRRARLARDPTGSLVASWPSPLASRRFPRAFCCARTILDALAGVLPRRRRLAWPCRALSSSRTMDEVQEHV
jgi:hypothetical protein